MDVDPSGQAMPMRDAVFAASVQDSRTGPGASPFVASAAVSHPELANMLLLALLSHLLQ
jgi:hypothetical protein